MPGFDLSHTIWVDPLVVACLFAAAYAPIKDFFSHRSGKARAQAEATRERNEKFDTMLHDWVGDPGRPGFDARPGIPERLHVLEGKVDGIDHEVQYNSGTSIKDAVHRTDDAVAGISRDLKSLQKKLAGS